VHQDIKTIFNQNTTMAIIIRKASQQDFPTILSLIEDFSLFQKTPEKVTITLEQMMAAKDLFQCFVAETSGKEIIGFASFYFVYNSWSGKGLYLDDLYVVDAFRKQGAGKLLLDAMIQLAKEEHCKKLRWQVSKWNSNAIDFYKKMGAVIDDTEINCDLLLS
jgi:GNAT superfamily N-acetyltransferase